MSSIFFHDIVAKSLQIFFILTDHLDLDSVVLYSLVEYYTFINDKFFIIILVFS